MNIAVLGASGMLGTMLVNYLSQYYHIVATIRPLPRGFSRPIVNVEWRMFDATAPDFSPVYTPLHSCQWAINAIGVIKQRLESLSTAYIVNGDFPHVLAAVAGEQECPVIQVATDCVYSGKRGQYMEDDPSDAIDTYGASKRLGEVESVYLHHLRCSIVGLEQRANYSLLGWFLSQPKGATIEGYTNHLWNGVTTLHFAKVCQGIFDNVTGKQARKLPHVQHLVPADSVSKYELLKLFAQEFGREDLTIKPVKANDKIDRTLATVFPEQNRQLWDMAGYTSPPTIAQMVRELAEYAGVAICH